MKAHVGTDPRGIVHSLSVTAANVADITELPKLLHGQERELYWGSGVLERLSPAVRPGVELADQVGLQQTLHCLRIAGANRPI